MFRTAPQSPRYRPGSRHRPRDITLWKECLKGLFSATTEGAQSECLSCTWAWAAKYLHGWETCFMVYQSSAGRDKNSLDWEFFGLLQCLKRTSARQEAFSFSGISFSLISAHCIAGEESTHAIPGMSSSSESLYGNTSFCCRGWYSSCYNKVWTTSTFHWPPPCSLNEGVPSQRCGLWW